MHLQGVQKTASEALHCKDGASTLLLSRLYAYRSLCINKYMTSTLKTLPVTQLLILGAGLDDYTQWSSPLVSVFIVDLPDVIAQRNLVSKKNEREVKISIDLSQTDLLLQELKKANFSFTALSIVLIEFVLGYLEESTVKRLLLALSSNVKNSILITYDLILPISSNQSDSYLHKMFSSFSIRGAPLLYCAASTSDYSLLLRHCGWSHLNCLVIQDALSSLFTEEERSSELQESSSSFDEYASLAILNKSYAITLASNKYDTFCQVKNALQSSKSLYSINNRNVALHADINGAEARLSSLEALLASPVATTVDFVIRPARDGDYAAAVELFTASFHDLAYRYKAVNRFVKLSAKQIAHFEGSPHNYHSYIVERSGLLVGYCGIMVDMQTHSAEIKHLCTHMSYRRQGVASLILRNIIDDCNREQVEFLRLSSISEQISARSLYLRFGFEEIETMIQPEGYALTYMIKSLP